MPANTFWHWVLIFWMDILEWIVVSYSVQGPIQSWLRYLFVQKVANAALNLNKSVSSDTLTVASKK